MSEKRCYTVQELQEILGVSRPTIYNLLKKRNSGGYTGSPIHFPGTENKEIKPGEKADWNKNERDHG